MVAVLDVKAELQRELASESQHLPAIQRLELRDYLGMFEYHKDDEQILLKNLVIGKLLRFRRTHLPHSVENDLYMHKLVLSYQNVLVHI